MIPRATYRLQFHKGFPFAAGAEIAAYLARLGISHVYASPIATARAGSNHGYDVIDPTRINPELGGEDGFRALVKRLRREGLGVILDIVPNHVAVGGGDNAWWLDVLQYGEASAYAGFFDIDWHPADPALHGKVAAPFLGSPYAEALRAGDVRLRQVPDATRLDAVAYGVHHFPIRPADHVQVLREGLGRFDGRDPDGFARLHALLERQNFRLAWWRTAGDEINWRRFFDVTELAALRMERAEVFEAAHALPLRLYGEGLIDGVRVDHVDGLADPAGYCRTLRAALDAAQAQRPAYAAPGPAYFVVEKILAEGETLAQGWRTDGTTGYDYMNESAALLHDPAGEAPLTKHWATLSGRPAAFAIEERAARLEVLSQSFGGQLEAVVRAFHRLARSGLATRDLAAGALRRGLTLLLAAFPTYRTYGVDDAEALGEALAGARVHAAPGEGEVLERLVGWLGGEGPGDPAMRHEAVRRFEQLSAPLSAKSVEDTAFYRYGRLLSRNDVGSAPGRFAGSLGHFHATNAGRAARFPHAMVTTATHDHKRGEDVRVRLAVLSSIPDVWIERTRVWTRMNAALGPIDPADEYQLHQTLTGAWPLELSPDDANALDRFAERVAGWQQKALREAKLRSSWSAPDEVYEQCCREALQAMLDPRVSAGFLEDLDRFVRRIAPAGALYGMVQAFLRCTAPGVPDIYQGAELWDLSLVDPDNRSPVDYSARTPLPPLDATSLMAGWKNGRAKQALIARTLTARRELAELFRDGGYEALEVRGARKDQVVAFLRRDAEHCVLVAAPIRCAPALLGAATPRLEPAWWGDTTVALPDAVAGAASRDLLDGTAHPATARLAELMSDFSVCLRRLCI